MSPSHRAPTCSQTSCWSRHRQFLAARQPFTCLLGLGWFFSAWKIYGEESMGTLDPPEKLLCLKNVWPPAASLSPDLACLDGPEGDFIVGDTWRH